MANSKTEITQHILSEQIQKNIASCLNDQDLVHLSNTCSHFQKSFQEKRITMLTAFKNKKANHIALVKTEFEDILDTIANNTVPEGLDISGLEMQEEHHYRLFKALESNQSLLALNLNATQMNGKIAKALAKCLRKNIHLQALSLDNNQISDKGTIAILDALRFNNRLQILSLRQNSISDKGISNLAQVFRENNTLSVLMLDENSITEKAIPMLCKGLELNQRITTLSFYKNMVQTEFLNKTLEPILRRNIAIKYSDPKRAAEILDVFPLMDLYERNATNKVWISPKKTSEKSRTSGCILS